MAAALTSEEIEVVRKLEGAGMSSGPAVLAVAMATREHSRPEPELIDIVRQYQGLETREAAIAAISQLKGLNWLIPIESYGVQLLSQSRDLRKNIAQKIGVASIERKLAGLRSTNDPLVEIIGSMTDSACYASFIEKLRHAKSRICLPMLATSPSLSTVPILLERASAGVSVQILLATPELVSRLRGNGMVRTSKDSIAGWWEHSQRNKSLEVRLTSRVEDMWLASCALIDEELVRFDLYDPLTQRSLQGTLFEVRSREGCKPNFISILQSLFDSAWEEAIPIKILPRICHYLQKHWQLAAAIVFFFMTMISFKAMPASSGILGSISATFFANPIVVAWPRLMRKVRGK